MTTSLVVFYSRSGHTRRLAHRIAEATHADLEELTEAVDHSGTWGWAKSIVEAAFGWTPRLLKPLEALGDYDVVYLGGPVWMGRYAPPVRAYARRHLAAARRVAFFATQGGTDPIRAWDDLADLAGVVPTARMTVQDRHLDDPGLPAEVASFVFRAQRAHVPADGAHRSRIPAA